MSTNNFKYNDEEIHLDPKHLEIDEATLIKYMSELGSIYNYYAQKCADIENIQEKAEGIYEQKYLEKFHNAKSEGCSDKAADARAKIDKDVKTQNERVWTANGAIRKLKAFLKSLDKCHENAQSIGHFKRKEMEKITGQWPRNDGNIDDIIAEMKQK